MECLAVAKVPEGSEWVYEIKLDGYRALGIRSDSGVRLQSRRNNSFNRHYPLIVEALGDLPEDTVVDDEVVALDESGFPAFSLIPHDCMTMSAALDPVRTQDSSVPDMARGKASST